MLPPRARMRRGADFSACVRSGRRCGSRTVVVHVAGPEGDEQAQAIVGFVVSKAVGDSVTRHRVQRRLRHVVAALLPRVAPGHRVVVRASSACVAATPEALARDLERCLTRVGVLVPEQAGS